MKKTVFSAVLATAIATGFAFAPSAFADDMKKDSMAKDSMAKDSMKKDSMAKDSMKKDSMAKDSNVQGFDEERQHEEVTALRHGRARASAGPAAPYIQTRLASIEAWLR